MSDNILPFGWCVVELRAIASKVVDGSHNPPEKVDAGFPMLSGRNIENGHISFEQIRYVSEANFKIEDSRTRVAEGDVLLTIVGTIGRVAVVTNLTRRFTLQRSVAVITPSGVDPKFLAYQFQAPVLQRFLSANARGTAQKGVYLRTLNGAPVLVPPVAEQRRIVGKIEALFSELDAGVANLKQARAQLAVYRQALLKHAFEGHLTADWRSIHHPVATVKSSVPHPIESWRFTTLADLTEYVTSGSRGWAEFYADAGPIFIRAANLNRDRLDLSDVAFVSLPKGVEGTRTRTRLGDVFITITGANVTKAGFLDHEIGEAYVSQHVALCRPTDPTVSEYLYLYIISNAGGRRDLEKAAYGAGKPGLNLDNLRTLQIPMPNRAEIPLIVKAIRSQLSAISALEADIDLNLQKAEALRQSILKKAFAGELVPQDPDDEPAAALLARIRAEREAKAGGSPKKESSRRPKRAS